MPRTISTKPDYSVRWWRERNLEAPDRDAFDVLKRTALFRFAGQVPQAKGDVVLAAVEAVTTMMASPAISVPGGFTSNGLPVGVQIVGRHHDEWSILQLGHAFEEATQHGKKRPVVGN